MHDAGAGATSASPQLRSLLAKYRQPSFVYSGVDGDGIRQELEFSLSGMPCDVLRDALESSSPELASLSSRFVDEDLKSVASLAMVLYTSLNLDLSYVDKAVMGLGRHLFSSMKSWPNFSAGSSYDFKCALRHTAWPLNMLEDDFHDHDNFILVSRQDGSQVGGRMTLTNVD